MATTTRRCDVFAIEGKRGGLMFGWTEGGGHKPRDAMTLRALAALARYKLTFVAVFVALIAARKLELPIAFGHGPLLFMTTVACRLPVFALQQKRRQLVGIAANGIS